MSQITKNNIAEVLKHNGWEGSLISNKTIHIIDGGRNTIEIVYFAHPNWLQSIELLTGKLEPLPEPSPLDVVDLFNAIKIGQWICRIGCTNYDFTENKWYKITHRGHDYLRIKNNFDDHKLWTNIRYINDYWNLNDIRDYNPDKDIVFKIDMDKLLLKKEKKE